MNLDFPKLAEEGIREETSVLYPYKAKSPRRSEHESQDDESGNERVDIQNDAIRILDACAHKVDNNSLDAFCCGISHQDLVMEWQMQDRRSLLPMG